MTPPIFSDDSLSKAIFSISCNQVLAISFETCWNRQVYYSKPRQFMEFMFQANGETFTLDSWKFCYITSFHTVIFTEFAIHLEKRAKIFFPVSFYHSEFTMFFCFWSENLFYYAKQRIGWFERFIGSFKFSLWTIVLSKL